MAARTMAHSCALLAAVLALIVAKSGVNCWALPDTSSDDTDDDSTLRRLVKRQVATIYYPPKDSTRHMGLDPYEERLLIALLGGCIALVFALVVLVICCRTYSLDRNLKGGGGAGGWGMQPMLMMGRPGQMSYPGQAAASGRPTYYPTGYQPSVQMDPAYLDPAKAGGLSIVGQQQQQQQQQQQHHQQQWQPRQQMVVDNTVYG